MCSITKDKMSRGSIYVKSKTVLSHHHNCNIFATMHKNAKKKLCASSLRIVSAPGLNREKAVRCALTFRAFTDVAKKCHVTTPAYSVLFITEKNKIGLLY